MTSGARALLIISAFAWAGACGGPGSPTAPPAPSPAPAPTPPSAAAPEPSPMAGPSPTPTAVPSPLLLRSAEMHGAHGHAGGGTVDIVRTGRVHTLEFRGDFFVAGGSNDVYLAQETEAVSDADLNLGVLKALSGAQTYRLPSDGRVYRYVLIWCRPLKIPIGVGELR